MNREQLDALIKQQMDLLATLKTHAERNGTDGDGKAKEDALEKAKTEKMTDALIQSLESRGLFKPEKKMIYGGEGELQSNEERISFGKWVAMCVAGHPQVAKDYYEKLIVSGLSEAQGGYLLPTGYDTQIIGELNNAPTIIQKCTRYPQTERTKNIPKWFTDLTIAWVAEAGEKGLTKPTWTQVQSVLAKMYAIIPFGDEFLEDDPTNAKGGVTKLVGENMAIELERIALVGTTVGGDAFNGLYYAAGVNQVPQAGASVAYDDLVDIWNNPNVLEKYRGKPEWYINRTVLGYVLKLKDNDNRPLVNMANALEKPVMTIFGDKVNISSQIPNTLGIGAACSAIFYGDYKYILIGEKKGKGGIGMTVSQSAVGTATGGLGAITENAFMQDETWLRFVLRRSVVVAIAAAFTRGINIT